MNKCGKATSRIVPLVVFILALSASIGTASAQEVVGVEETASASGILNRPFYVGLGLGGVFALEGGGAAAFRLEEDIGYHVFSFGSHPGLFVGGLFNQSFGKGGYYVFDIDARVGVDFNVYDWGSGALLVTPGVDLGVAILMTKAVDPWSGASSSNTVAGFNIRFNGQIAVALLDGLMSIWFRPIGIEVWAKGGGATALWDLNTGVLFNF
jgi:hypothetical protein